MSGEPSGRRRFGETTEVLLPPLPPRPGGRRVARGELLRKAVHMGVGLCAFLLRWLGPLGGAATAAAGFAFNLWLLPRLGGRHLLREGERARGRSIGVLLYPLAVLILILAFWRRLEVAAAAWGILAFGDGMASVVGMTLGRRKLPWNPAKSWAGTLAYWLFGGAAAAALLPWTAPGRYGWAFALACGAAAALLAAVLESLPQGLDDNLGVPLVTGLFLLGLTLGQEGWPALAGDPEFARRLALGAAVNLALAAAGYAARTVSVSGAVAGFAIGTAIWGFLGWRGYLVLLAFFVLGSAATKLGYRRKAARNLAQEEGGRRGARHAFANCGTALACAAFAATTDYPLVFALAFAGAFATAAADTMGSEIGQLYGRRAFLITSFRRVPPGTDGAVSAEGTAAGIAAAVLLGALGAGLGLYPWAGAAAVAVAAFLGTVIESLAGATLERRGLLDNQAINFLNTLVGALLAAAAAPLVV